MEAIVQDGRVVLPVACQECNRALIQLIDGGRHCLKCGITYMMPVSSFKTEPLKQRQGRKQRRDIEKRTEV